MTPPPLELDPDVVLGIDPGTIVVGYGAIRGEHGRSLRATLLEAGVVRAKQSRPLAERLGLILTNLEALIVELRPATVVVERAFTGRNPLTAIRLGEGRGLALASAARHGCRVVERTPAETKRLVAGTGSASKVLVAGAVASLLGLRLDDSPLDATDALALALSELHRPDIDPIARASERAARSRVGAVPAAPRTRR
ncbi:Crossover junction endodeoxyribonuclease RuvC [Planctomycetes bacterium Pla163]|uniref:Crossover junction endodeoxyribonuclease RuvC n=1 Tax=Rohdeia mirabilis TaxID=2528008 RepID=A0A518CXW7_9BACT|nr:Crossover junction endodeoxyribonuclease RuvC [Planctomycetes bacterium Pla163]